MTDKELEIIEVDGVLYAAFEYNFDDCGCLGGNNCAFSNESFDFCAKLKCSPDKRSDGSNVIFMEKQ